MSGGIEAIGKLQAGRAAYKSGLYNAAVAEDQANLEILSAGAREAAIRRSARRLQGQQLTALAASGGDISSGSALDVLKDSAVEAELDALTARYEGQLQARSQRQGAKLARMQGKQARTASYFSAASSMLSFLEK